MAQNREYEVILLGATGYTGKIVGEWFVKHLPQDLKWAVAGRNATKLQAVIDELAQIDPNRRKPGKVNCRSDDIPGSSNTRIPRFTSFTQLDTDAVINRR